jgi:hypothetical protein
MFVASAYVLLGMYTIALALDILSKFLPWYTLPEQLRIRDTLCQRDWQYRPSWARPYFHMDSYG